MTTTAPPRIVLFDGECGMCNRLVHFLIHRDRRERLRFAPLQGRFSRDTLPRHGIDPDELDTACFVVAAGTDDERVHIRSSAILRALAELGGGWRLLGVFLIVPAPLRDLLYRFVATRRHRLSAKMACPLMTPAERARFLPDDEPVPAGS